MAEPTKPVIAWTDPPAEPEQPLIPLVSPKPGQPVYALITSTRIVGVTTHFIGQRTRPCSGVTGSCEGCLRGRPKRWKGYLCGQIPPTGRHVIIEITYEGYRSCKALHGVDAPLYGRKIILTRMGKSPNSRVEIKLEDPPTKGVIGQAFDLEAALIRIWYGMKREKNASKESQFQEAVQRVLHQVGEMPPD